MAKERKQPKRGAIRKHEVKGHRRSKPKEYGVTKNQFFKVLEKVSRPVKEHKTDNNEGR